MTKVYENTGGAFTEVPAAGLTGVYDSSVAWGDYDNDGDLDILLTGYASGGPVTKVYENTGGAFTEVPAGLTGVSVSSVAWGDYDNDGDLDILLTGLDSGYQEVAKVYENLTPIPNTPPTAPGNLAAVWSASGVTLSWDAATDAETPAAGLTYNLRLGTTPGGSEITAAMADDASGYRCIPALGNANHNLSWTVDVPAPPVYWSVQALDAGYAGSAFALEQMIGSATGVTEPALPRAYALRGIAPNPFNPVTTISFDLPQPARVRLSVFNIAGRLVRVLIDEERASGSHDVIWNGLSDRGQQVASGVYFCRMEAGSFRDTRRMTLLK